MADLNLVFRNKLRIIKKTNCVVLIHLCETLNLIKSKIYGSRKTRKGVTSNIEAITFLRFLLSWWQWYDLGADPNIRIVTDGFTKDFNGYNEAYAWLRQLRPFDDTYLSVFKKNLEPYLTQKDNGTVTFKRETKTYVLWWKPMPLVD